MKISRITSLTAVTFFALAAFFAVFAEQSPGGFVKENIKWLGHDTFRIEYFKKIIYTDPFKISRNEKADIILITHEHYDHFSKDDIAKISGENTVIISTPKVIEQCKSGKKTALLPGESTEIDGIKIEAIPAYNINKRYHPMEDKKLGFIINLGNMRIYHAGDTDLIKEMEKLGNISIALLPVGGTYTMTAAEAVTAAKKIKPRVAIPMHYGSVVGSKEDALKFKEGLKDEPGIEVLILPLEK